MGRPGISLWCESEVQLSVKVTTWVWENSRSRGPARLVLLAIADNAHDDGAQAWPSMTTLVRKTGLAERTVHRAIKSLIGMGELEVRYNAGPGLCNLYRVRLTPAPKTPPSERHPRTTGTPASVTGVPERHRGGVTAAPLPPSERHPEPSIEPSVNHPSLPSSLTAVPSFTGVGDMPVDNTGRRREGKQPRTPRHPTDEFVISRAREIQAESGIEAARAYIRKVGETYGQATREDQLRRLEAMAAQDEAEQA